MSSALADSEAFEADPEESDATTETLDLPHFRALTRDLLPPSATIYWADLLGSLAVALISFELLQQLALGRWELSEACRFVLSCAAYATCCFTAYRAGSFIHETAHVRRKELPYFHLAWNLLCGIPFLMPSYFYAPHLDHHRRDHYGTEHDGEYFSGSGPRWLQAIAFLAMMLVVPFLAVFRFLILTPLAWIVPGVRSWIDARASAMVVTLDYERPPLAPRELVEARTQEALCFAWCASLAAVLYFRTEQFGPRLVESYFLAVGVLTLNGLRTLGAHRWRGHGEAMSTSSQLLDSVNYPHNAVWNELLMPVGLRFHALHHLLPALPYHALPAAHERLVAELPEESPYWKTSAVSISEVLWEMGRPALAEVRS